MNQQAPDTTPYNTPQLMAMKQDIADRAFRIKMTGMIITAVLGIAAVAACPNIIMKLGGLGLPRAGFDWHTRQKPVGSIALAEGMARWLTYGTAQFGTTRCMFESNCPVDTVSYAHHVRYKSKA